MAHIEQKGLKPHDLVECLRCGKTEFVANAESWNAVFDKGVLTGFICGECQTDEEDLEAQVNEAMTDYSQIVTVDSLEGLLDLFRPRWGEALGIIASGEEEKGNTLFREHLESFRIGYNRLFSHNPNAQLKDIDGAYKTLVELGELPEI